MRGAFDENGNPMRPSLDAQIATLSAQVAELRADVKFFREQFDDQVGSREAAEKRLAEVETENAALLQSAAAKGDEPDLLIGEWRNATARAKRAEEAFEIAKADRDRLVSALRPFAEAAVEDDCKERSEWRYHDDNELVESSSALVELTAGDFRRATAALSASGPDVVKETARRCVEIARAQRQKAFNRRFWGAAVEACDDISSSIVREFSLEDGE